MEQQTPQFITNLLGRTLVREDRSITYAATIHGAWVSSSDVVHLLISDHLNRLVDVSLPNNDWRLQRSP